MAVIEACLSCSTQSETGFVWDVENCLPLHTFNQIKADSKTLSYSNAKRTVVAIQKDKAVCTIHYATRPQPRYRCTLPEKMSSTAINEEGTHLVAGSQSGRLYFWFITSGQLIRMWEGHYKAVTAVSFSQDGSFLCSGSEDASVKAWNLATVLDVMLPTHAEARPHNTFLGHTLGVTDVKCAHTDGWVASCSRDRTVRVHDSITGQDLFCCILPALPRCLTINSHTTSIFSGCQDGKIYQSNIYPSRSVSADFVVPQSKLLNALTGSETTETSKSLGQYHSATFEGHVGGVTAIGLTTDSLTLVSGGADGNINIWQVASRQLLRSFNAHKAPITSLTMVKVPVKMPSEKESQLSQPFTTLKRTAVTGEAAEDYSLMAFHGSEQQQQKNTNSLLNNTNHTKKRRKGGQQQQKQETPVTDSDFVAMPTEAETQKAQNQIKMAAPAPTNEAVSELVSDPKSALNVITRLYTIVSAQQKQLDELKRAAAQS